MEYTDEYRVDLTEIRSREELHEKLAEELSLPEWYGGNLDALYDVFSEMQGGITFAGYEEMEGVLTDYARAFRAVCMDAAEENPRLKVTFREPEPETYEEEDYFLWE